MKHRRCVRNERKSWRGITNPYKRKGAMKTEKCIRRNLWRAVQRLSTGTELTAQQTMDLRCPVDG